MTPIGILVICFALALIYFEKALIPVIAIIAVLYLFPSIIGPAILLLIFTSAGAPAKK